MLRTILVDDDAAMRFLLRNELEGSGEFTIVGEAANGAEGILEVGRCKAGLDLVLLDVNMPIMDGLQALPHIRQAAPGALVAFLTMHHNQAMETALEHGPAVTFSKGLDAAALTAGLLRFAAASRNTLPGGAPVSA